MNSRFISKIRHPRRSVAVAATVASLVVGGVVSYAYFNSPSTSTFSTAGGTAAAPSTVTLTGAPGGGASGGWWSGAYSTTATFSIGTTQTWVERLSNGSTGPVTVSGVTMNSWSSNVTGCDPTTLPNSFTEAKGSVGPAYPFTIAAGANQTVSMAITMVDDGSNQSACIGAAITFNFTQN